MKEYAMRRKDRATREEEALEILQSALFATVSCLTPEGHPYGVTVSHAVEGRTVYFHCGMAGLKVDSFAAHDRVCISAVEKAATDAPGLTTNYRSAVAFGRIHPCDAEEAKKGLLAVGRKFTPDYMAEVEACIGKSMGHTRVYAVEIESITGKANIK